MRSAARAGALRPVLPYGQPLIEEDDIEAVAKVLRSGWLTTGPLIGQFEAQLAETVGARHAVVCANGTAALHLAAIALGLGAHSTVIVPAVTFVATANAARYVGARVVFADVDARTGLMTPDTLEAALTRAGKADAVFPVHLAGQSCDMPALHAIAERENLLLLEDACHALGTRYDGPARKGYRTGACSHSDMTVFSFHPVKTIAMGEGGAITTRSAHAARRLRLLRSHGIERESGHFAAERLAYDGTGTANPWYYELQELGFNYRASDIHCALGLSQLKKLPRFAAERARLVRAYDEALEPLAPAVEPLARVPGCSPAWHLYGVRIDFEGLGRERAEIMHRLAAQGVGTQVHYLPVPFHPYYAADEARDPALHYPGAASYYAKTLSLPLFVGMSEDDPPRIAKALASVLGL
jgi:UDP-4-amino-4,6-dideoxy-N-acetyl-beta-L-altrosamine transaminase